MTAGSGRNPIGMCPSPMGSLSKTIARSIESSSSSSSSSAGTAAAGAAKVGPVTCMMRVRRRRRAP